MLQEQRLKSNDGKEGDTVTMAIQEHWQVENDEEVYGKAKLMAGSTTKGANDDTDKHRG